MNLHLIQADNAVRQDLLVRNEDELIHAMNHFQLRGGGGTDFRPAFAYVSQLCAEKKFSNLRGLLYFTDGMGSYPARRPAYDTAFLFLGDRFDDANVPPWAMKVVLDEDEFTGPSAKAASALAEALNDEDDPYLYSNLADMELIEWGGLPPTLDHFLRKMQELNIPALPSVIAEVRADQANNTGNRTVRYDAAGAVLAKS